MGYSLEQFSSDCRRALLKDSGPDGLEVVRQFVGRACVDEEFVAKHFATQLGESSSLHSSQHVEISSFI